MLFSIVTLLALGSLSAVPLDSNLVANPGLESGAAGWKFWARATDSGRMVASSQGCRTGNGCLFVSHEGAQDWGMWPVIGAGAVPVNPGEVWKWTAWTRAGGAQVDAHLSFVTRDPAATVLSWNASATGVGAVGAGWVQVVARIAVPKGCASIQPRITGYGKDSLWLDDASLVLETAAPVGLGTLAIANDSVRLEVDPYDLSMRLIGGQGADTLRIGSLPDFHLDSSAVLNGGLRLAVRHLAGGWNGRILANLSGGAVKLSLLADSASVVPDEFVFPGTVETRPGQRIAIPRGTGVAWPVEGPLSNRWSLTAARFWEWQVSQSVTGATDGKTGFVISIDQPSDAKLDLEKGSGTLTRPVLRQIPAKGVFGHERSAVIAPVRGGGFAEMARRHRVRQDELSHTKTWTRKVSDNPEVGKLRGAVDWWLNSGFNWKSFDTLRWMGMERALIHWTPWYAKDLDSLRSRGWLMSVYDNWADAFPNDTTPNGRENPTGAVVKEDGSYLAGWLEKHDDGTTRQALEICAARHPHLARANAVADAWTLRRNARFIDVEMAVNLLECWSKDHPVDRAHDLEARVRALSVIKDSLRLVTGSEQAREASFAHVDYGEGSMSIASTSNAGYDWSTPEAPEGTMDSLSMDPSIRVPLLPLASHDVFTPTWYTGDGQSKVPARWDDKDAWNMLYATMPLIAPKNRAMWDSLRVRYMRSTLAIGAFLSRTQFEPMTDFVNLSGDGKVQRTAFANGWTSTVNFDAKAREEGGTSLPAKGWRASGPDGVVERAVIDGAVRTRVRLSDRWFLDPEGSEAFVDGIRTAGSVSLARMDDTTVALSIIGDQSLVDLVPAALPWPATRLRAQDRTSGAAVALEDRGAGTLRLAATAGRFVLLRGDFGTFTSRIVATKPLLAGRVSPVPHGWELSWSQVASGPVQVRVLGADGRSLYRISQSSNAGVVRMTLPRFATQAWVQIETSQASQVLALPRL
ncbi:MAG: hypothetical protein RL318_1513 [Fibrobacterota bacterium]|jgi:hypothetical protein